MLKFASKKEALQHLANITGNKIKIAKVETGLYDYDMDLSFGLSFSSKIGETLNLEDIDKRKGYLSSDAEKGYEKAIKVLENNEIEFTLLDEDKVQFFIESENNKIVLSTDAGFGFQFTTKEDMERAKNLLKGI